MKIKYKTIEVFTNSQIEMRVKSLYFVYELARIGIKKRICPCILFNYLWIKNLR